MDGEGVLIPFRPATQVAKQGPGGQKKLAGKARKVLAVETQWAFPEVEMKEGPGRAPMTLLHFLKRHFEVLEGSLRCPLLNLGSVASEERGEGQKNLPHASWLLKYFQQPPILSQEFVVFRWGDGHRHFWPHLIKRWRLTDGLIYSTGILSTYEPICSHRSLV